jgi:micrococcal nuclease
MVAGCSQSTVNKNTMSFYKTKTLLTLSIAALLAGAPALVFSASGAAPASKANWSGKVTHVEDGDSIKVRPAKGGKSVGIRIDGIDAPEICQVGGKVARDKLQGRLIGKRVDLQVRAKGVPASKAKSVQAPPQVARVLRNKQDQGKWLVSQGLAWSYRYRNNTSPYAKEEKKARAEGLGLFSRTNKKAPLNPRDFRKQYGSCAA